jgi:predicted  nucleic acid-binding Zn-ribbon protein
MSSPIDLLPSIPDQPLGTVVHIGAGATDLSSYARLHAKRLVMVEGNADSAQALRAIDAPHVEQWEIIDKAVAATAGPLTWNRYNVASLDGPLDAGPLVKHYPRLQRTAAESVQAISVGQLLTSVGLRSDGQAGPHVLVLDVPGQELALVESLEPRTLHAFDWLAVRGRGPAVSDDTAGVGHVAARLDGMHFERMPIAGDDDGLWPMALFRAARNRLDWEAAVAERDALAARVAQFETELQASRDQVVTLQSQAALAEAHRAESARLEHELANFRNEVASLRAALQTTTAARDEQAHWHQENAKWAKSLSAENERLMAEIDEAKRELAGLRDGNAALRQQIEQCRSEREAIERRLADQATRQQLLDAEILKAQAQLELVKDVLLREKNF